MHPTEHYTSFTEIPTVLKNETRISALHEIYSISLIGRHVTTKKPFFQRELWERKFEEEMRIRKREIVELGWSATIPNHLLAFKTAFKNAFKKFKTAFKNAFKNWTGEFLCIFPIGQEKVFISYTSTSCGARCNRTMDDFFYRVIPIYSLMQEVCGRVTKVKSGWVISDIFCHI